jgi:hypothetical protein
MSKIEELAEDIREQSVNGASVSDIMQLITDYYKKEYEEKLSKSIEIPDVCICDCKKQDIIELVYPLPPICNHCRKMIRRSFYNVT